MSISKYSALQGRERPRGGGVSGVVRSRSWPCAADEVQPAQALEPELEAPGSEPEPPASEPEPPGLEPQPPAHQQPPATGFSTAPAPSSKRMPRRRVRPQALEYDLQALEYDLHEEHLRLEMDLFSLALRLDGAGSMSNERDWRSRVLWDLDLLSHEIGVSDGLQGLLQWFTRPQNVPGFPARVLAGVPARRLAELREHINGIIRLSFARRPFFAEPIDSETTSTRSPTETDDSIY